MANFWRAPVYGLFWFEAVMCTVIICHWIKVIYWYNPVLDVQLHSMKKSGDNDNLDTLKISTITRAHGLFSEQAGNTKAFKLTNITFCEFV